MKKILSLLFATCLTALCVSCNKDSDNNSTTPTPVNPSGGNTYTEGVYHPSKKISKVITSYQSDYYSYSYSEVWKWGEKDLEQINEYDYNGDLNQIIYFTYENNRLSRMLNGSSSYLEYHYDSNNKLTSADKYWDGTLYCTYTFTHSNGNITKIEEQYYYDDNWKGDVDDNDALELVLGKDLAHFINKKFQKHQAKNGSKGNSKYVYNLTWKNGNIVKLEYSEETDPTWKETVDAEYDTYNNPYYGFFWAGISGVFDHSKNNMVKATVTETELDEVDIETVTYTYTYDGKYPLTKRTIYQNGEIGPLEEFEYLN